jgi:hypothetical protein
MTRIAALGAASLILATATAIAPPSAEARPRPARCVVTAAGAPTWRGPCRFDAGRGGSFTVAPARGRFANGVASLSLDVVRPGVGEVRGLTADGINSRWGSASRSARDRACWVGTDFSLCVY